MHPRVEIAKLSGNLPCGCDFAKALGSSLSIHCHCTKRSEPLAVVINTAEESNGDMIRQKKEGPYILEEKGKEDISTTFDTEQVTTIILIRLQAKKRVEDCTLATKA